MIFTVGPRLRELYDIRWRYDLFPCTVRSGMMYKHYMFVYIGRGGVEVVRWTYQARDPGSKLGPTNYYYYFFCYRDMTSDTHAGNSHFLL